eukprot:m.202356 g.202356  ORF g.202356 m.202356 type:complete len:99 (-) comp16872_c15_seq1:57-353(-)
MADTIDGKKEEFRNYLESSGIIDAITKVMIGLYEEPEKPNNPLEFIQQHLSVGGDGISDVEALKKENEELKARNEELLAENLELKKKLEEAAAQEESS